MKRIVTWFLSTLTVLVLLFGYRTSTSGTSGGSSIVATPAASGTASSSSSGSGSESSGSAPPDTSSSSDSTVSTVTGPSVDTRWGPVQVALTVAGGKITKVEVPVYPTENPRDVEINSYALPILIDETIKAQSASIDMISGATVTSNGYLQSLQGALDEAKL